MYTHGYGSRLHTELQLQFDPHNLDCPGKEHEHLHAIGHDHYDLHHRRRGRGGGTADAVHHFDPDGGGRLNQHPRGHLLAAIRPNEAVWGTAAGTTSHDVRNGLIRIIQNNFLQNQQSANLLGVAFSAVITNRSRMLRGITEIANSPRPATSSGRTILSPKHSTPEPQEVFATPTEMQTSMKPLSSPRRLKKDCTTPEPLKPLTR